MIRFSDEQLLRWVKARCEGKHPREFAPDEYEAAREATNKVRLHDIQQSGEPEGKVRKAYW